MLFVFFAIQILSQLAMVLIRVLAGLDPFPTGEWLILSFAVAAPLLVLATAGFLRAFDRRDLASIGARWPAGGRRAALRQAVASPLGALALAGAWLALLDRLPAADVRSGGWSGEMAGAPGAAHLALLLAGFLVQGGVEEWLLRGYIYHALRQRWRRSVAILASSLLFAALHGANPDFSWVALVNTFLAGVILALLVERTGSLWSPTLAHGAWNFAISCLVSLPISGLSIPHLLALSVTGPPLLTGDGFGPEGSLLLSLLAAPLAAVLALRLPAAAPLAAPAEGTFRNGDTAVDV